MPLSMWKGEEGRTLAVYPPPTCCGTCIAAWPKGALAFLTGSDEQGNGFTLYLTDAVQVEAAKLLVKHEAVTI